MGQFPGTTALILRARICCRLYRHGLAYAAFAMPADAGILEQGDTTAMLRHTSLYQVWSYEYRFVLPLFPRPGKPKKRDGVDRVTRIQHLHGRCLCDASYPYHHWTPIEVKDTHLLDWNSKLGILVRISHIAKYI
jgi:hypothetical protein